jgi:hypothetical protein
MGLGVPVGGPSKTQLEGANLNARATRRLWSWHRIVTFALVSVALALMPVVGGPQNVIDYFFPQADNYVRATAVQADGKILVGGDFTSIAGQTRHGVARELQMRAG